MTTTKTTKKKRKKNTIVTANLVHVVMRCPGRTACELAEIIGQPCGNVRCRLNDARHRGWVRNGRKRRCRIAGRVATTWWAVVPGTPSDGEQT